MNKKLTFPELADLLSKATNTSKRMSELFLRELFAVIAQSIIDGEPVRIKDFGTFKTGEVNARKSVDVNTGQTIEIPGHKKVVFTPDKVIADAINSSFASFEAVILDDDLTAEKLNEVDGQIAAIEYDDKLEEQIGGEAGESVIEGAVEEDEVASENVEAAVMTPPPFEAKEIEHTGEVIKEVAEEDSVDLKPEQETTKEVAEANEQDAEGTHAVAACADLTEETEDVAASPKEEEDVEKDVQDEVAQSVDVVETTTEAETSGVIEKTEEHNSADDEYEEEWVDEDMPWSHKHRFLLGFITGALLGFLLALVAGYAYVNYERPSDAVPAEVYDETNDAEVADTLAVEEKKDTVAVADVKEEETVENKIVTDTVTRTNFLARMAKKYYGSNHFWVYIYEENKSKISNPNNVKTGTVMVIPPAEKYGIDKDDKASVAKAIKKEGEIQAQFIK